MFIINQVFSRDNRKNSLIKVAFRLLWYMLHRCLIAEIFSQKDMIFSDKSFLVIQKYDNKLEKIIISRSLLPLCIFKK